MINTGKVTNVENEGNKTIVHIEFKDDIKTTVVLPHEDIKNYKDKYVTCAIDFHDNVNILEIRDHDLV
ncbi:MAG: hypothetical protein H6Q68_3357 [Firmicutes bacterium]|nr:hypothetical protein [Bacillota bacterium]